MVSDRVLGAMRTDIGSRHSDFEYLITFIRNSLVQLAGVNTNTHTAIPMAGSGTLAIESTLSTALSGKKGTVLVLENGMYGQKIANICKRYGNNVETVRVHTEALEQRLQQSDDVIGVVSVHYETTSGILNPVFEIGKIIKQKKKDCIFIVDAISSFGGIPYDATNIDYAVSSACKCLQGVPGVSFVIANISEIEKQIGMNQILTLDLAGQYQELERTRQFRFTPPTHVLLALKEALLELEDEGGVEKRMKRFKENASILNHGMQKLGFKHSTDKDQKTHIVTSFQYPENPRFVYGDFMDRLDRRGLQLCAERTNTKGHFRVGTIGNLYPEDMKLLVDGIEDVCAEMDIKLPLS
uniref:Alanine--glyoxylate aminotransferase n=1 Tax=Ciona savignyi TaxID=51511 RepID=H2ZEY8_CIOSA